MKFYLLLLISIVSCDILLGGWTRDSLEKNDMLIDRSRQACEDEYYKSHNTNENKVYLFPFALYSQIVNGINYRFLIAAQDVKSNEIEILDYIVYTGPFSETKNGNYHYEVTQKNEFRLKENLSINSSEFLKINEAISSYFSTVSKHISFIRNVYTAKLGKFDPEVYLVKFKLTDSNETEKAILMPNGDKFEVLTSIRDL